MRIVYIWVSSDHSCVIICRFVYLDRYLKIMKVDRQTDIYGKIGRL